MAIGFVSSRYSAALKDTTRERLLDVTEEGGDGSFELSRRELLSQHARQMTVRLLSRLASTSGKETTYFE